MKKHIIFLAVLFVNSFVFAQSAQEFLTRDIEKALKVLPRDTYFYSYLYAPTENSADGTKKIHSYLNDPANRMKWMNDLFSIRAGAFWDLNYHETYKSNAGAGMYFAIDPAASTEYGETAVIMTAAQGTVILNLTKAIVLSNATKAALLAEGITTSKQMKSSETTLGLESGITTTTIREMVKSEHEKFRVLIQTIFKEKQVQLIQYLYRSRLKGLCKTASSSSFVLIGKGLMFDSNGGAKAIIDGSISANALYSSYPIQNRTPDENIFLDIISRFRAALEETRSKGPDSSKTVVPKYLSSEELNSIVEKTYLCERKW